MSLPEQTIKLQFIFQPALCLQEQNIFFEMNDYWIQCTMESHSHMYEESRFNSCSESSVDIVFNLLNLCYDSTSERTEPIPINPDTLSIIFRFNLNNFR